MSSQRTVLICGLEVTLCEEPRAFKFFSASGGRIARETANRHGLVAVYAGWDRHSLFSDVRRYRFFAMPAEFAEALASGKLILPETRDEREAILTLADRNLLTIHFGRKRRYQLTDVETVKDIRRQLRRIRSVAEAGADGVEAVPRRIPLRDAQPGHRDSDRLCTGVQRGMSGMTRRSGRCAGRL